MCVHTCMWEIIPLRNVPRLEMGDMKKTSGGASCVDPEMCDENPATWLQVPRLTSTSNEACVTAVTADNRGRRLRSSVNPKVHVVVFSNQFTALSCVAHISPRLHCVGLPLGVSQFPKSMIRFDFWFQGHDSIFKPYRISFCKDHQIIGFISWQLSFTCSNVSSKR